MNLSCESSSVCKGWNEVEWSECSSPCGLGNQTRSTTQCDISHQTLFTCKYWKDPPIKQRFETLKEERKRNKKIIMLIRSFTFGM